MSLSKVRIMEKSIKERFAVALQNIRGSITSTDKNLCKRELDISDATLKRYLNGEVANESTAASMLSFFKKQMADREALVA